MNRRNFALAVALGAALGCVPPVPPSQVTPHEAMAVSASFAKTWDAVIDAFGAQNIPIRNIDRASGFISTDQLGVDTETGKTDADCGSVFGLQNSANKAVYNVIVRGDSAKASVKATVRWITGDGTAFNEVKDCTSKGTWETAFEGKVKARAESKTTGTPG